MRHLHAAGGSVPCSAADLHFSSLPATPMASSRNTLCVFRNAAVHERLTGGCHVMQALRECVTGKRHAVATRTALYIAPI
jgi:hypothetical protein